MKKVNEVISKIESTVGVVMLTGIVLLVFISAVTRVFKSPIVWSVDMAQLLFVWISMFGADLALKKCAHMGVDIVVRKLPDKLQKIVALFSYLLCTGFAVFIAYWGINLFIENYLRKYQTLQISYSYATAAVPVVSCLMILTLLEQIIDLLRGWNKTDTVIR